MDPMVDRCRAAGACGPLARRTGRPPPPARGQSESARDCRSASGCGAQIRIAPARAVEVVQYVARVDRMRQLLGIDPPSDPLLHLEKLVPSAVPALR